MRVLWIDIDTLRADHLGCYGYHRATSPHIDALAARGVRFDRCYASDLPCLPSRTALATGRFGTRTGVVGHGGSAAELLPEGAARGFSSLLGRTSFAACLRKLGLHTVTLSSFAERHSAYHWLAGFEESASVGKRGLETADEVFELARDWLARKGARGDWFLHVQLWDPHTPYRAPAELGEPFADAPLPSWLDERVRARHFQGAGPHSAQEPVGFSNEYPWGDFPRQPRRIDSMAAVRAMFDGYDTGVLHADACIGRLLAELDRLGVAGETAIVVTADHGENLGELNVYCDHHTADEATGRVPMIVCLPGQRPRVEGALHYQFDVAATLLELLGGVVPPSWDARSFAPAFREQRSEGRDHLVLTQGAWTCQRAVRFERYLYLRTDHDGYHGYPRELLFDLERDPHEQHDCLALEPMAAERGRELLQRFVAAVLGTEARDPLAMVVEQGGPFHVRGRLLDYVKRLRATGRAGLADALERAHPSELASVR